MHIFLNYLIGNMKDKHFPAGFLIHSGQIHFYYPYQLHVDIKHIHNVIHYFPITE